VVDDETIFDGCFKRETFVFVLVRLGSCEIDLLLLFFGRLRFVVEGIFVPLEEFGRVVVLFLLLRRTVEADEVEQLDDELLIKR
jgi:hypothetical protein